MRISCLVGYSKAAKSASALNGPVTTVQFENEL